jgi:hypothetical protein
VGEAKRVEEVKSSGKTLAERNREKVEEAEQTGWAEFVSRYLADPGLRPDNRMYTRALLGLGNRVTRLHDDMKRSLDSASEVASSFQNQVFAVFARQEVLHDYAKKEHDAVHAAFASVVERQDADAHALSHFVAILLNWWGLVRAAQERFVADDRAYRKLGWLKRRKAVPPKLVLPAFPRLPKFHAALTLTLPAVPSLPPLMPPQEMMEAREDAKLTMAPAAVAVPPDEPVAVPGAGEVDPSAGESPSPAARADEPSPAPAPVAEDDEPCPGCITPDCQGSGCASLGEDATVPGSSVEEPS